MIVNHYYLQLICRGHSSPSYHTGRRIQWYELVDLTSLLSKNMSQSSQEEIFTITITGHVVPVSAGEKPFLTWSQAFLKYAAALSSTEFSS